MYRPQHSITGWGAALSSSALDSRILSITGDRCQSIFLFNRNRNRNRKLQTSKAPLKSQAQDTSLFTSAASNQRGFPKNSPWEA